LSLICERYLITRALHRVSYRGSSIYGVSITGTSPRTYSKIKIETRVFLDPKMYLFPIPQTEIDKYPNHALEQSPGW